MQTSESIQDLELVVNNDTSLSLIHYGHGHELYQLINKNRNSLRQWLPWVDFVNSLNDLMQLIHYYRHKHEKSGVITMCIIYKNQAAGILGFNYIDWKNRSAALGYWLGEKFRGKGLMVASCRRIINYGFFDLNLHKINIMCASENFASQSIPEQLNFRKEGLIRDGEWLNNHYEDLYSYALLCHEASVI